MVDYIRTREFKPTTMLALRQLVNEIGDETVLYKDLAQVPSDKVRNFRNDMYMVTETVRLMQKSGKPTFAAGDLATLMNYKKHVDNATKFIPTWVKVAVAIALGLGTMVGWKRIGRHGGGEDRQEPPHLRAGCGRRDYGHGDDRRR